ncbi:hypothetical protein BDW67DRAFT_83710 [Aspergillus spinulosporus]
MIGMIGMDWKYSLKACPSILPSDLKRELDVSRMNVQHILTRWLGRSFIVAASRKTRILNQTRPVAVSPRASSRLGFASGCLEVDRHRAGRPGAARCRTTHVGQGCHCPWFRATIPFKLEIEFAQELKLGNNGFLRIRMGQITSASSRRIE